MAEHDRRKMTAMAERMPCDSGPEPTEGPWAVLAQINALYPPEDPAGLAAHLALARWAIEHGYQDEAAGILSVVEHYADGKPALADYWTQAQIGLAWCCLQGGNSYGARDRIRSVINLWKRCNKKANGEKTGGNVPFGYCAREGRLYRDTKEQAATGIARPRGR